MRIFIAIENVLTKPTNIINTKELYEKNFFFKAKPQKNIIEDINKLIRDGFNLYILDNYSVDSNYALSEKKRWLKRYLPDVSASHIFLIPYNESKTEYLKNLNLFPLQSNDFLLDNYENNLIEWENLGGTSIHITNEPSEKYLGKEIIYPNDQINNYSQILSIVDAKTYKKKKEFLNQFLAKWKDKEIETNDKFRTKNYQDFYKEYKNMIQSLCLNINFELVSDYQNFYSFLFVVKSNYTNYFFEIDIQDIRYFPNAWENNIIFKTLAYSGDAFGGKNNHSTLENLGESLLALDKKKKETLNQKQSFNQQENNENKRESKLQQTNSELQSTKYVKLEEIKKQDYGSELLSVFFGNNNNYNQTNEEGASL